MGKAITSEITVRVMRTPLRMHWPLEWGIRKPDEPMFQAFQATEGSGTPPWHAGIARHRDEAGIQLDDIVDLGLRFATIADAEAFVAWLDRRR